MTCAGCSVGPQAQGVCVTSRRWIHCDASRALEFRAVCVVAVSRDVVCVL